MSTFNWKVIILYKENADYISIHMWGNPRQVLTGLKLSMGAAEVHATLRIKIVCTLLKSRLTGSPAQSQNTYQEQFQF